MFRGKNQPSKARLLDRLSKDFEQRLEKSREFEQKLKKSKD
jgi:hypothetical protein